MRMQMAIDATERGGTAAMEELRELIPEFRDTVDAQTDLQGLFLLGVAAATVGDMADARATLERAHALDPTDTQSILVLALIYRQLNDHEKNAEMWALLVAEDPTNTDAVYQLADAHRRAGNTSQAIEGFEAVVVIAPEDVMPYEQLILLHQTAGDADAVRATRERLKIMHAASTSPEVQRRQYFMRDRFAVDDLSVLVIEFFDPSTAPATYNLIVTDSQGYSGASFIVGQGDTPNDSSDYMLSAILSDGSDWMYPDLPAPLNYEDVRQRITDILSPNVVVTPIGPL